MRDVRIAVFARAPERGQVKTRLASVVGDEEALAAHVTLLDRTLGVCIDAAPGRVELWIGGDVKLPPVPALADRYRVAVHEQLGADLGARMRHTLLSHVERGRCCIVVGSDIPAMRREHLLPAVQALASDAELVLGASEDGGYWLIGLTRDEPSLFAGMPWSTDRVLAETLRRAGLAGRPVTMVDTLWDVDTAADWRRWKALKPA